MKRLLIFSLVILIGVLLLWRFPENTPDAGSPVDVLWSWVLGSPDQPRAAVSRQTISSDEARAMVTDLTDLRTAIASYFMETDKLPRTLSELNYPALPNVRLTENGSIEYRAGGRSIARVLWRPKPMSTHLAWDCVSPDIGNIADRVRDCRYLPAFKPLDPIRADYSYSLRLLFEFDRSNEEGLSAGERLAFQRFLDDAVLKPSYHPQTAQITGYADPMGDASRNIRLAEARAAYVREALAASGMDRSVLSMRVIGADPKPASDCPASLAREERINCFGQSRRVDIILSGQRDL